MKTLARIIALLSTMLLISLGLLGQKHLLVQDINPLPALANITRYDVGYRYFSEDKIQLNDWMINREQWETAESLFSEIRLEKESSIEVKEWMIEPFGSDDTDLSEIVKEEKEVPLELQKWMYCCTDWKIVLL